MRCVFKFNSIFGQRTALIVLKFECGRVWIVMIQFDLSIIIIKSLEWTFQEFRKIQFEQRQ